MDNATPSGLVATKRKTVKKDKPKDKDGNPLSNTQARQIKGFQSEISKIADRVKKEKDAIGKRFDDLRRQATKEITSGAIPIQARAEKDYRQIEYWFKTELKKLEKQREEKFNAVRSVKKEMMDEIENKLAERMNGLRATEAGEKKACDDNAKPEIDELRKKIAEITG